MFGYLSLCTRHCIFKIHTGIGKVYSLDKDSASSSLVQHVTHTHILYTHTHTHVRAHIYNLKASIFLQNKVQLLMPGTWEWHQTGSPLIQVQGLSAPGLSGDAKLAQVYLWDGMFLSSPFSDECLLGTQLKVWECYQTAYLWQVLHFHSASLALWGSQNLFCSYFFDGKMHSRVTPVIPDLF